MNKKRLYDLAVSFFGLFAARGFALLSSILIARVAGAETFGEYSLFITIFVIASEVPNAIDTTFIRFSNSLNRSSSIEVYQSLAFLLKFMYASILVLGGVFFSSFISTYVFNKPEASDFVYLSLLSAAFMSVHNLIVGAYQQKKDFVRVAFIRPALGFVVFISVLYLVINGDVISIDVLAYLYLYVAVFLSIITLIYLYPKIKGFIRLSLYQIKSFSRLASLLLLSSVLTLVSNRMDLFFLASYLDFESVGYYGAAVRVSIIVALITAAMTTVYVPRATAATESRSSFDKYMKTIILYSVIQTLLALLIVLNMDAVILLLFGEDYSSINLISSILVAQVLFEAYARGFQALIQCGPHPRFIVYSSVLRLFLSVVFLLYLVPEYGVVGGAISVALTSFIVAIVLIYIALRDCKPAQERFDSA